MTCKLKRGSNFFDEEVKNLQYMEGEGEVRKILLDNGIRAQFINQLAYAGLLTREKLTATPPMTVSFQSHVPLKICLETADILARAIVPQVNVVEEQEFLRLFNDDILDNQVFFPRDGIIEFTGPAGSGKSNIVYHLLINQIIADNSRKVILISTEGHVPTQRIHKIAQMRGLDPEEILSNLLIKEVSEVIEFNQIVNETLPQMFSTVSPPSSIVAIDSIAALFRSEFDMNAAKQRAQLLFDMSTTLKWISNTFGTLILTTNQVTASMGPFTTQEWVPSLGLAWSNCINMRVRVTKSSMKRDIDEETPTAYGTNRESKTVSLRTMFVEISPRAQDVKATFYISDSGVHGA